MSTVECSPIEKLRKENLEQFLILVRMHLSFVVDINTDDVDSSTDKPKQFRWNFHRKAKSSTQSNNGKPVVEPNSITDEGMSRVYELIDFLSKEDNVKQEGIFRRTGSLSRQQELRQLLLSGSSLGLQESRFSVHDCASVLKGFIAELPQPLLMDQYYQTYCTLAAQYPPNVESSENKLLTALQLLLLLLSPVHRDFLLKLLTLLKVAADHESSNRMSPDTLATMFTPHLLCPRKLSPEIFHTDSLALAPLVSFMISHCVHLFESPEQLATDAAAYFTTRERKRIMSPNIDLDESITDRTAANTVFTFTDRHRTRAENETNQTDTALAQLYAHIQALPDSTHKRRLIKQFNRQNGYGTPIQLQRTGKVAGSRSFGDSIKRHIFNKGLLNKTPKKMGSGTNIPLIEEKTSCKEKLRFSNEDPLKSGEVSHKNVMLKNLAKMASTENLNDEHIDSDGSNDSTMSEGSIINRTKKRSPKFVSEPNLSILASDETPKNTKNKSSRLFRSKILSASQNINKKYQKRSQIRNTPTCVSCFDEPGSSDSSFNDVGMKCDTPKMPKPDEAIVEKHLNIGKVNCLTSTPGISETVFYDEDCTTPYTTNFRRASMSPITKSTQKLSKAMQESIMTPRSRKPLIITSEQRVSLPEQNVAENILESSKSSSNQSISPKNDSDFVSSDDEILSRSSIQSFEHNNSNVSAVRSENTRFVISSERRQLVEQDLNTTLCASEDYLVPKFKISHEVSQTSQVSKSLSGPFRDYLLSRSVLTATPVDLSLLNTSSNEERISDSLLYCLDGNVPSDLTSSINNLAVNRGIRSPLKSLNGINESPNRKRLASKLDDLGVENKKILFNKNTFDSELRETNL